MELAVFKFRLKRVRESRRSALGKRFGANTEIDKYLKIQVEFWEKGLQKLMKNNYYANNLD